MFDSLLKRLTNYWEPKIEPIGVSILSVDKISDNEFKTLFDVRFKIGPPSGRRWRFDTKGSFENKATIDEQTLIEILKTTDYEKYVKLNMKRREMGDFNYEYHHND